MKILIVDDDFTSRLLMQEILRAYGMTHVAVNAKEAVEAVRLALNAREPYQLICLDIMMPEVDGHETLRQIRALEEAQGIFSTQGAKIFMTTALDDMKNAMKAFKELCDAYLVKPINKSKLIENLKLNKLIP
jgi:two-component system chemotaxis response regulator CheY